MEKIRVAIIGIGNCASSLLQGIEYYRHRDIKDAIGLMHWEIGGYAPYDIEVVAEFEYPDNKLMLLVKEWLASFD